MYKTKFYDVPTEVFHSLWLNVHKNPYLENRIKIKYSGDQYSVDVTIIKLDNYREEYEYVLHELINTYGEYMIMEKKKGES